MTEKMIIIITGGPGTGKSYMSKEIIKSVPDLTVLSYDSVKEKNFDIFGFDNEVQKNALNGFSLEEFYLTLQKNMWLSKKILIEYPFYQRHAGRLREVADTYGYRILTVYLYGDLRTIYERGIKRDIGENRHPGHLVSEYHKETYDSASCVRIKPVGYEGFCRMMEEKDYHIRLGEVIDVDVTDVSSIPYANVIEKIMEI